ncbi:hypothetical protein C1N80_09895 [Brachybacterium sp. SGAir0954]|uniref:nucleotidyl transferase AbiEii/AbiGii toxin family protein n=1 Tax=Brachybacterium sp. SGAir0954 TaxID=2571029 RepID=UPI0010CCB6F4|nr:nucleotidyl transferase AbiEii/AbiGii toxin family protein [Brachybacterium sp. SGAir0954]QCR53853.1 hypothetical protein C1N80_09895 [Brachybacterium sp. SGAir0954]
MKRGEFRDRFELIRATARAPMRTVRHRSIRDARGNTWRQLDELSQQGVLVRLAHGVCTAPPDGRDGRDGRTRTPGLEASGPALATPRYGDRRVALMGIGAARFHGAIPRALGSTTAAVPLQGIRPVRLATGTAHFVGREMERLDVTPESTELGTGFVTTPEQTVVDLLQRPGQGEAEDEALRAVPSCPRASIPRCSRPSSTTPRVYVGRPAELSISWVVFFGGTALSRTYLTDLRLSEDVGLICTSDRASTAARIEEAILRGLRRSIGRTTFTPSLTELRRADHSVLDVGGVRIQLQLLCAVGHPSWPTATSTRHRRYADAPAASLRTLIGSAFVATDRTHASPTPTSRGRSPRISGCRPSVTSAALASPPRRP